MKSMTSFRLVTLTAACMAVIACNDSGTGPQDVSLDDVLADVAAAQTHGMTGMELAGATSFGPPAAVRADNCAFNAGTQMFVCPSTTVNGITFSRSFQLLDASGAPQSSFSRGSTAAVRTITDVDGVITTTTGANTVTIDVKAHQDATLSGLLTGTHVLNATGTGNAEVSGGGLNHSVATTQTITNLELPRRDSDTPYPKSGTIATQVVVTGSGLSHTTTTTLTFDGSSTATLVITTGGLTRTCAIDLTRKNPPSCS